MQGALEAWGRVICMLLSSIFSHPTRMDLQMVTEAGYYRFRPSGGTFLTCCGPQEHNYLIEYRSVYIRYLLIKASAPLHGV
jgi:hypothetical protein